MLLQQTLTALKHLKLRSNGMVAPSLTGIKSAKVECV